jgi:hypothetical protein
MSEKVTLNIVVHVPGQDVRGFQNVQVEDDRSSGFLRVYRDGIQIAGFSPESGFIWFAY